MLNCFEETNIKNTRLPLEWQSQSVLDELNLFLQMNWEQRSVFYDDGEVSSRQQFLTFTGQRGIRTGHYIGTISFRGHQLNIFPKMFKVDKDDHETQDLQLHQLMKNLVQWIDYCNKFEYPFINIRSDLEDSNNLRELFIALYVRYVEKAIDRSLFYQYEEKHEDSPSIKGKISITDFISNKMPSGRLDRFLCSFSSFEVDNRLNRIIRYTCKLLYNEASKANQKILHHILTKLNDVSDIKCNPSDCDAIHLSKLQRNYHLILSMSKMFLLNQTSSYKINTHDSFCFLFPTDYLFEGFISGFMQSALGDLAKVRLQASEVALVNDIIIEERSYGNAFIMRHDILVEHKDKGLFILDTKYKEISRLKGSSDAIQSLTTEAKQPDLYQMFTYAIKRDLKDVYLLYPMYRLEDEKDVTPTMLIPFSIDGVGHCLTVHIIRLPFIFEENLGRTKERLTSIIMDIFV